MHDLQQAESSLKHPVLSITGSLLHTNMQFYLLGILFRVSCRHSQLLCTVLPKTATLLWSVCRPRPGHVGTSDAVLRHCLWPYRNDYSNLSSGQDVQGRPLTGG